MPGDLSGQRPGRRLVCLTFHLLDGLHLSRLLCGIHLARAENQVAGSRPANHGKSELCRWHGPDDCGGRLPVRDDRDPATFSADADGLHGVSERNYDAPTRPWSAGRHARCGAFSEQTGWAHSGWSWIPAFWFFLLANGEYRLVNWAVEPAMAHLY